jgi:hypothetical protein
LKSPNEHFHLAIQRSKLAKGQDETTIAVQGGLHPLGHRARNVIAVVATGGLDGEEEVGAVGLPPDAGAGLLATGAVDDAEGGGKEILQTQQGVQARRPFEVEGSDPLSKHALTGFPGKARHGFASLSAPDILLSYTT